jgi:cell division protein FtsL
MTKVNVTLALLLVVCALGLVTSQNRARKLFVELQKAQVAGKQLEVQWNQLELEQTALAKNSLIDSKARRSLAMQPVSAERTLHLNLSSETEKTAMSRPDPRKPAGGKR